MARGFCVLNNPVFLRVVPYGTRFVIISWREVRDSMPYGTRFVSWREPRNPMPGRKTRAWVLLALVQEQDRLMDGCAGHGVADASGRRGQRLAGERWPERNNRRVGLRPAGSHKVKRFASLARLQHPARQPIGARVSYTPPRRPGARLSSNSRCNSRVRSSRCPRAHARRDRC